MKRVTGGAEVENAWSQDLLSIARLGLELSRL